ncbi:DNA repair protein rad16, partial [Coemansia sp. RSA 487]
MVTTRASSRKQDSSSAPPTIAAAPCKRSRKPVPKAVANKLMVKAEANGARIATAAAVESDTGDKTQIDGGSSHLASTIEKGSLVSTAPSPGPDTSNPVNDDDEPLHTKLKLQPLDAQTMPTPASLQFIATHLPHVVHDNSAATASGGQPTANNASNMPVASKSQQNPINNNRPFVHNKSQNKKSEKALKRQQQQQKQLQQPQPQPQPQPRREIPRVVRTVRPIDLPEDNIDYSLYCQVFLHHPHLQNTWRSLEQAAANKQTGKADQPHDLKMQLLPFQQEGVWWMMQQESTQFRGGILADEMGMGKTLQTIALLLLSSGKPTLVVCPTVALMQWKAEIEKATDALSVFVFYGNDHKQLVDAGSSGVDKEQLAKHNVILTTYAVMESGYRREHTGFRSKGHLYHEPSLLHQVSWFRLVLDEAHNIKDRSSNSARAAFALKTQRMWALTGTPLHNHVGELFSLIRLTKADPFSMYFCHSCDCKSLHWNFSHGGNYCHDCGHKGTWHFCYWNMHILKPIQLNSASSLASRTAFRKLGILLDTIMLRRTKIERAEDLGLPPRIVVPRRDKSSPAEEELYTSLFKEYKDEFGTYSQYGTVLNSYTNIFELITRMRLAANHPDLLRFKVSSDARVGCGSNDTLVCAICNEEAEDPIVSRCKH